jgi:uncharacterized protein (TIGR03435 family)
MSASDAARSAFNAAAVAALPPKSGIEGRYNFVLELSRIIDGGKKPADTTRDGLPNLPPDPVSVLNGALRPYGLSLQSRTAPVQVLVVDRANQMPTAN